MCAIYTDGTHEGDLARTLSLAVGLFGKSFSEVTSAETAVCGTDRKVKRDTRADALQVSPVLADKARPMLMRLSQMTASPTQRCIPRSPL